MTESAPTDRELEALKVLWDRREATVRDIADAMNAGTAKAGGDELAYTTVLSLLQVMEQKGLVDHRREGKAYVYLPLVERQSTFRQLAGSFLDKVFDGAVGEYLVHALDSKRLSDDELDQLEAMLAAARQRAAKTGRKRGANMNDFVTSVAVWLADLGLLSTILLTFVLAALAAIRQPAQRLAMTKATLVALFLLAALCAAPRWSVIHLLAGQPPRSDGPAAAAKSQPLTPEAVSPPAHSNDLTAPSAPPPPLATQSMPSSAGLLKWSDIPWATIAVGAYFTGVVVVLTFLCLGMFAVRRLVNSAQPSSSELAALIGNCSRPAGYQPGLLISPQIDVPVALGVFRPKILLPATWTHSKPHADLRSVLAHELAHVSHCDLAWLAFSRVLLCLLWPQPLFWFLRSRMRLDQEALADAAAAEITTRQNYAEQLVAWARSMPAHRIVRLSSTVGLWEGPSQLRQRIALLVNERFTMLRSCSRGWRNTAMVGAVAAALLLSLVTLAPNTKAEPEPSETTENQTNQNGSVVTVTGAFDVFVSPAARVTAAGATPNTIAGRCTDESGQAIPGAEITIYSTSADGLPPAPISQQLTDADGKYGFSDVVDLKKSYPNGIPNISMAANKFLEITVRSAGRASLVIPFTEYYVARNGYSLTHKLATAATLSGRVTNADGKPVADALVAVGDPMFQPVLGTKAVYTDARGHYAITDAAPFDPIEHKKKSEEFERRIRDRNNFGIEYSDFPAPPFMIVRHPDFPTLKTEYDRIPGEHDVQLQRPAIITGRVVYADSGRPANQVEVQAWSHTPSASPYSERTTTDKDGAFRFTTLPAGSYGIWATTDGWLNEGVLALETAAGQTTDSPDLKLSKGGEIRLRLLDAKTKQPIPLAGDEKAIVSVQPEKPLTYRDYQQFTEPQPDGTFIVRATPDKTIVYLVGVLSPDKLKWVNVNSEYASAARIDVAEGGTYSLEVNMEEPPTPGDQPGSGEQSSGAKDASKQVAQLDLQGKPRESLVALNKIIEEHPDSLNAKMARADVYHELGENNSSIEEYDRLLETDLPPVPKMVASNNLAYILSTCPDDSLRNGKRAVELVENVKELVKPRSPELLDTLAAAYAEAGNFDKAVKSQQEAIHLDPNNTRFQNHLELYESHQPLRHTLRDMAIPSPKDDGDDLKRYEPQPADIRILVAQHVMLLDAKIVEWADVEKLIESQPDPKLVTPHFYFTHGALPEREEQIRTKVYDLHKRLQLNGHSWASILPRASARYDAIRTAADLVPDESLRIEGTVETADGLPIEGAEVVLCPPAAESVPYKTLDIYLRNERLRTPLDEIVTVSDDSGRFQHYPPAGAKYWLVALHHEGFAVVRSDEFAKSHRLAIQPWAHINGLIKTDVRFEQAADVDVPVPAADGWPELVFHQMTVDLGPPSPDGTFELAFVPPSLNGWLSRNVKGDQGSSYSLPVKEFKLTPRETLSVAIDPPTDAEIKRIDELSRPR